MSVGTPSRQAILSLYHNMLRTSQSFSSYNFREYFVRRTKDTFRAIQNESDPERVRSLYSDAVRESTVLRRSAIVNQLYGGWKLAVEVQDKQKQSDSTLERADS
ncbi:LYR motif-containing protein 4 [Psilocybe cubensis]|uniref:Complex 1 LYR protein domain-containing protein n=2 Tax=Psilocybe cubensis TaxID=181762 RepID=A0A8H8CHN3_PSICU|nr:LYR motif-containing protein 4 [Psilocybe cubensis]KAH9474748.1 LYR motif-containing protein 4 [Psilocybe cubensis]